MWFLKTDTLFLIIVFCLLSSLLRRLLGGSRAGMICPFLELGVLFYIDKPLALFYLGYICIVYIMAHVLKAAGKGRGRGLIMLLFCLLSAVPFLVGRLPGLFPIADGMIFIGIAFNMLKAIDALYYVYYGGEPVSFPVLVNYMLFLPVFTAGPVFRYRDFLAEMSAACKTLDYQGILEGMKRFVRGAFKKIFVLKIIVIIFDRLRELGSNTFVSLCIILLSYLMLYFDLSGYSDMAIGLSMVAGFNAPENFKRPWDAPSLTKFWRSWHASVSDFIREHIYVVVSRYKLSKWHSGVIGLLSMILMAMWHDFNLLFLLAGIYNGLLLMGENFFSLTTVNKRKANKAYYYLRCVLTNFLFAVNTLVFTLEPGEILPVLSGLLHM